MKRRRRLLVGLLLVTGVILEIRLVILLGSHVLHVVGLVLLGFWLVALFGVDVLSLVVLELWLVVLSGVEVLGLVVLELRLVDLSPPVICERLAYAILEVAEVWQAWQTRKARPARCRDPCGGGEGRARRQGRRWADPVAGDGCPARRPARPLRRRRRSC